MAEFPKTAKAVIVGLGGIVGASVAHNLIERGWADIVGIDKVEHPDRYWLNRTRLRLSRPTPIAAAWRRACACRTPTC